MELPLVFLLGFALATCVSGDVQYTTRLPETEHSHGDETIYIAAIEFPPFLMTKGDDKHEGFLVDYLAKLCESAPEMFCHTEFHMTADNKFGTRTSSGVYDGMIHDVVMKDGNNTQMSLGPFKYIKGDDPRNVAFTDNIMDYSIAVLIHSDSEIKTLGELVNSTGIKVGTVRNSRIITTLSHVQDNAKIQALWSLLKTDNHVENAKAGIDKALEDHKFAIVLETAQAEYYRGMNCELTTLGDIFTEGGYSFAVSRHHDHLSEHLDHCMAKLKKEGVVKELSEKWLKYGACSASSLTIHISAMIFSLVLVYMCKY